MCLRFMKLVPTGEERNRQRRGRVPARRHAGPEQVECGFDPGVQSRVAVKRPDQKCAENGLAKNVSDLRGGKVVAGFATVLSELNHLAKEGMHAVLAVHTVCPNRVRLK